MSGGLTAPVWIALCAMLVAVAAAALATITSCRLYRIIDNLTAALLAFDRVLREVTGDLPGGPVPAPALAEDPPTVTLDRICPPVAARPYLAAPPRPGRHAAART